MLDSCGEDHRSLVREHDTKVRTDGRCKTKNHGFRAYDFLDWFPCHKLDCVVVNVGKKPTK